MSPLMKITINIVKPRGIYYMALVFGLYTFMTSCSSEDPSAKAQAQRDLVEALAKISRLEEQLAQARTFVEKEKPVEKKEPTFPTMEEVEKSLAVESLKLKEQAKQKYPFHAIEKIEWKDLKGPTVDYPFSCKTTIVVKDSSGKTESIFWQGRADPQGKWEFIPVTQFEGEPVPTIATSTQTPPPNVPAPEMKPEAPKPVEKAYDIPLKDPVMGPKGR